MSRLEEMIKAWKIKQTKLAVELIPNRNLKASKDCGFRLCRDGLDEAGATRVATELVQHVSGMAETQPLRGKALLRLFENGSIPRYSYRASIAVP